MNRDEFPGCPRCTTALDRHGERALQAAASSQKMGLGRGDKVFIAIAGPAFLAAELLRFNIGVRGR